jgi:hypothetical protein
MPTIRGGRFIRVQLTPAEARAVRVRAVLERLTPEQLWARVLSECYGDERAPRRGRTSKA